MIHTAGDVRRDDFQDICYLPLVYQDVLLLPDLRIGSEGINTVRGPEEAPDPAGNALMDCL